MTASGPPLTATYRLQLTPDFGFARAREVVPYLRDLGVSHLYLSPSFQARTDSQHGYDIVDPTRISEELGGEEQFERLATTGLGVILDIVPNHMATDPANALWTDPAARDQVFDLDPDTGLHRRFFDVDHLAGVRQEDPDVFAHTHALVVRLLTQGTVHGIRVDHPDGLADPARYVQDLRDAGAGDVWVEKILHPGEPMPSWPVNGTTGYDVLADIDTLFADPRSTDALDGLYATWSGETRSFDQVAHEARMEQATTTFEPEVERLRQLIDHPDMAAALCALDVYRTYVDPEQGRVDPVDRAAVARAVATGGLPADLARVLLLEDAGHPEFVRRFQQTTPPVMAKGVEDTAFYRYHRLLALNEVGNDPGRTVLSVDRFHAANAERQARFPLGLVAATTHDTKRSADVRARILAATNDTATFGSNVRRWYDLARGRPGSDVVSDNVLWFVLQTVLGAGPIGADRLTAYLVKAMREAKVETSWTRPDEAWEARLCTFVSDLLADTTAGPEVRAMQDQAREDGRRLALRQTLLRATVPGVPDTYQGDESWYVGLVDPDNRRPVDWADRTAALARVRSGAPGPDDAKIALVHRLLALRAQRPDSFRGDYTPIPAGDHTVAFVRGDDVLVIVALRPDPTADMVVPDGSWTSVSTGAAVRSGVHAVTDLVDGDGLAVAVRG